jgi:hypothetical protein
VIEGLIAGDSEVGPRSGDFDTLVFQLSGTQAQIDQFRKDMTGQSSKGGSVTWKGNTYTWQGFETIQFSFTVVP